MTGLRKCGIYCCCCCFPVDKLCLTLCNPMDCSKPGLSVPHHLLEFTQIHVHWIGDAIQPFHPLLPSSPFAFNLSQHQDLFQWVSSSHQVVKIADSASASVLPMSIQGLFPLGLTTYIYVCICIHTYIHMYIYTLCKQREYIYILEYYSAI